jgi:hypothetical protein
LQQAEANLLNLQEQIEQIQSGLPPSEEPAAPAPQERTSSPVKKKIT